MNRKGVGGEVFVVVQAHLDSHEQRAIKQLLLLLQLLLFYVTIISTCR